MALKKISARQKAQLKVLARAGDISALEAVNSIDNENVINGTVSNLTLFVNTTGSDSNPGTAAAPFKTLQAAIDSIPKKIRHLVQVNVSANAFAGCLIQGFTVEPASNADPVGLNIRGTLVTATLATSTASGTFTAITNGNDATASFAVFTDATKSWTVNNLVGRFLEIQSGLGAFQGGVIVSNTATTITIASGALFGAGLGTYTIRDQGTSITTSVNAPGTSVFGSNDFTYSPTGLPALMVVQNCNFNTFQLRVENIKFNSTDGAYYGVYNRGVSGIWSNCWFGGNFQTSAFDKSDYADISLFNCYVAISTVVNGAFSLVGAGKVNLFNCASAGTSTSKFMLVVEPHVVILRSCYVEHAFGLVLNSSSSNNSIKLDGSRFVSTNSPCISVRSANGKTNGCNFIAATGLFLSHPGSVQAMDIVGPHMVQIGTLTISAATQGVVLAMGARLQVGSASAITSPIEVTIDGTNTTLAAMRAANPKLISSTYFSILHE